MLLITTEILIRLGSARASSTLTLANRALGNVLTNSTALLTSIAMIITNEYISKLKLRRTKKSDWINVSTLLCVTTLKQSVIDKKVDDKDAIEFEKGYKQFLHRRKEIMKNT